MNNKKIGALLLAIASTSSFAGTMGPIATASPERLLFIEGGFSYSYAFYANDNVFPEAPAFPFDGNDFYPNNFLGGYIGTSLYLPQDWLINMRYDMFGQRTKYNETADVAVSLAPSKLSFTLDKVWGDINTLSYGAGAGAVVEVLNDGNFVSADPTYPSESIQGRSSTSPLVEAFTMYRFANNFGLKLNAGYQIPINKKFGDGDLNVNLGVNYAFAI
jgi:hypothetical protein